MNPKALNTAKTAPLIVSQKDKDGAKQCLILADKFLKEGDFEHSRAEVSKAQKLDPSNPYAYAFLDRIAYFEEQRKKEGHAVAQEELKKKAADEGAVNEEAAKKAAEDARHKEEEARRKASEREKLAASIQKIEEARRRNEEQKRKEEAKKTEEDAKKKPEEAKTPRVESRKEAIEEALKNVQAEIARREGRKAEPKPTGTKPVPVGSMIEATRPVIAEVIASRSSGSAKTPGIGEVLDEVSHASHHTPSTPKGDIDVKLDEMRRQIEMLTKALDQERKVREEMNQQQLQGAIKQLRTSMEKAWVNGAPKEHDLQVLHELATSLGVPEDVEQTLQREVKLDMYSRAVKEVVAKQKLLRNSSRTLEWLRKVYQVTLDEYLEYESKFLMDLVADQYKGTILLVSSDEAIIKELGVRLKSGGYAVVAAVSPENALEKIEKLTPHYILCDMEFSQGYLSGIKFLHVLRANSKFNYIPFILMCETNDVSQMQKSELRPTEGYVEKPVDFANLNAVMNEKLMAFRSYLSSI